MHNIPPGDDKSFLYCILAALHPVFHNVERRTTKHATVTTRPEFSTCVDDYIPHLGELNIDGLKMPMTIGQLDEFERMNPTLSISVFTVRSDADNGDVMSNRAAVENHRKRKQHQDRDDTVDALFIDDDVTPQRKMKKTDCFSLPNNKHAIRQHATLENETQIDTTDHPGCEKESVRPLRISGKIDPCTHINLLLIADSTCFSQTSNADDAIAYKYALIRDFSSLMGSHGRHHGKSTYCRFCLKGYYVKRGFRASRKWEQHNETCPNNQPVRERMTANGDRASSMNMKEYEQLLAYPFVVYS